MILADYTNQIEATHIWALCRIGVKFDLRLCARGIFINNFQCTSYIIAPSLYFDYATVDSRPKLVPS